MNNKNKTGSISVYKKMHWKLLEQEEKDISFIIQRFGVSDIIAKILLNRGIKDENSIQNFLSPKLRKLMPNPFLLKDMDKGARRIAQAIKNNEKIVIFADYDVDGATSSAVFKKFFKNFGVNISIYVPCRFKEGYGPNIQAFQKLIKEGNKLIITVDCGIVAFKPIEYATRLGVDVIVVDHHLALEKIPECCAVINPNRLDDKFEIKNIAAVGVSFFVITAVRSFLRDEKYFEKLGVKEPDLIEYLDLVALGTVCDVIPLLGINRVFVQYGLKLMRRKNNLGLSIVGDLIKSKHSLDSHSFGYVYGPRINAGGRMGKSHLGAALLSTNSEEEGYELALQLEKCNKQRKSIEDSILEEVLNYIKINHIEDNNILLAHGHNWHHGILGIIASRIKEIYQKPVFLISITNGLGKGSARSIQGVDIGKEINNAKEKGLLVEGGGHEMAGGFTIVEKNINFFYTLLLSRVSENTCNQYIFNQAKELKIDVPISADGINKNLLDDLKIAEPFGRSNRKPRFIISLAILYKVWLSHNNKHMNIIIKDSIENSFSKPLKCILFNLNDMQEFNKISYFIGKKISLVGYLQQDYYNEEKPNFIIEDFNLHKE